MTSLPSSSSPRSSASSRSKSLSPASSSRRILPLSARSANLYISSQEKESSGTGSADDAPAASPGTAAPGASVPEAAVLPSSAPEASESPPAWDALFAALPFVVFCFALPSAAEASPGSASAATLISTAPLGALESLAMRCRRARRSGRFWTSSCSHICSLSKPSTTRSSPAPSASFEGLGEKGCAQSPKHFRNCRRAWAACCVSDDSGSRKSSVFSRRLPERAAASFITFGSMAGADSSMAPLQVCS
mmetsp:Transcript_81667/g.170895  ORF Transcript_81667/g.170895 Transcript_81667/m.170895 type:complete len:248 (-) Transcript_81667:65-808(-)